MRPALLLLAAALLLLIRPAAAQSTAPAWSWARAITSPSDVYQSALATDVAGNVYVAGTFRDPVTLAPGTVLTARALTDAYVAKYSPAGALLWVRQLAGDGNEDVAGLVVDAAGTVHVAGTFYTSLSLGSEYLYAPYGAGLYSAQLNAQGQVLDLSLVSDQPGILQDMGLDAAGNLYLSGSFSGRITFGALALTTTNGIDQFLVKLDPAGVAQWGRQGGRLPFFSGGPAVQYVHHSLTVAPGGDCYLSWTINAGAGAFAPLPAPVGYGDYDVAIIKYDTQGTARWMRQFGSTLHDWAGATTVDGQGHLLATMRFVGTYAAGPATVGAQAITGTGLNFSALVQLDEATGAINWVRTLSADRTSSYVQVVADAAGNSYVVGSVTGNATFGTQALGSMGSIESDALVVSYSPQGTPRWAQQSGSYLQEGNQYIALDGTGHLAVSGFFFGQAQFGPTVLNSPGNSNNGFVARLADLTTATKAARPLALGVYPNPATDLVCLPTLASGTRVELVDALGRVARTVPLGPAHQLAVRGLTPGLYILRATDAQGRQFTGKLVVE